jgi:hypothetical protein
LNDIIQLEADVSFELTFGGLEAILARVHDIASDKRIAFQGRIKAYLRLGLLHDVRQGRGKAAIFRVEHLLQIATAVEFTRLGLTPERSVQVARQQFQIAWGIMESLPGILSDRWAEAVEAGDISNMSWLLHCEPDGLAAMTRNEGEQAPGEFVAITPMWQKVNRRRFSCFNFTLFLAEIYAALPEPMRGDFVADATAWADDFMENL